MKGSVVEPLFLMFNLKTNKIMIYLIIGIISASFVVAGIMIGLTLIFKKR